MLGWGALSPARAGSCPRGQARPPILPPGRVRARASTGRRRSWGSGCRAPASRCGPAPALTVPMREAFCHAQAPRAPRPASTAWPPG
eukprot:11365569-Alexandrium_andersonii.AAC.1